jgi:drug/metabolite transporter (DMT)-like permease
MLAFALNSLLCRAALEGGHADAVSFTTIRLASGALALGLLARVRGGRSPAPRVAWGSAAALFAYAIGFSLAYRRIPAGVGALLLFAAVQVTMIGAGLRVGERPRLAEWAGLGLSLGGLAVLTRPGLDRPDPAGAVLMLAAGASWGVYSLYGRGSARAVAVNAASFARAVPLAAGASLLAGLLASWRLDAAGALLALASGIVASGLGYAAWYGALRGLTATRAATVQLSVPPLAAAGGVLVLGEAPTFRLVASAVLILGGIALVILGGGPPRLRSGPPTDGASPRSPHDDRQRADVLRTYARNGSAVAHAVGEPPGEGLLVGSSRPSSAAGWSSHASWRAGAPGETTPSNNRT